MILKERKQMRSRSDRPNWNHNSRNPARNSDFGQSTPGSFKAEREILLDLATRARELREERDNLRKKAAILRERITEILAKRAS